MTGIAAYDVHISAGQRARDDEGASLNAVGNDAVLGAMQFVYAFYANGRSAGAFDLRTHFVQQVGEIGDFGFASAIPQHGFAIGESRGHQQVFGAGDRDFLEYDLAALEPVGGGFDVAVVLGDFGAEPFQSLDVKIDGARSDGASAGKRDAGTAAAGHQRAQHQR